MPAWSRSSGSGGSTCHLNGANDNVFRRYYFQTFERYFASLDALTNSQGSNIDIQLLGNLFVRSLYHKLADRKAKTSTIANTLSQAHEVNRNTDSDALFFVDFVEVSMQQSVCYRVELQLLHDGGVLLAIDIEVNHIDMGRINHLAKFGHGHSERKCFGQSVGIFLLAIKVTGNQSLFSHLLRSLLTQVASALTCYINFSHNVLL